MVKTGLDIVVDKGEFQLPDAFCWIKNIVLSAFNYNTRPNFNQDKFQKWTCINFESQNLSSLTILNQSAYSCSWAQ